MSTAAVLDSRESTTTEGDWVFVETEERSRALRNKAWVKFVDDHINPPANVLHLKLRAKTTSRLSPDDPDLLAGYSGEEHDRELDHDLAAAIVAEIED